MRGWVVSRVSGGSCRAWRPGFYTFCMSKPAAAIKLSVEAHRLVDALVTSGQFESPAGAIECALLLLKEKLAVDAIPSGALQAEVEKGLASARRSGWLDGEAVFAEIAAMDRRVTKRRKSA
jgi:Arc/MetJ-type ribon-helix-helix transcriptional regulator